MKNHITGLVYKCVLDDLKEQHEDLISRGSLDYNKNVVYMPFIKHCYANKKEVYRTYCMCQNLKRKKDRRVANNCPLIKLKIEVSTV